VTKIPVWRTIGAAYRFAFANLATVIGIVWLPLTILLGAEYFAIRHYLDVTVTAMTIGNRFVIYGAAGYFYIVMAAAIFLEAMIAVPIMRQALGLRSKGAFVHLALGPAELRMFGAFVSYNLLLLTLVFAGRFLLALLAQGVAAAADAYGAQYGLSSGTVAPWSLLVLQWSLFAGYVILYVRLWFFLAPVVIAERKIDLIRSWTLTHGNFWRAFFVVAFVSFPVWLLYVSVQLGFVGVATFGDTTSIMPMASRFAGSAQIAASQMRALLGWLPYLFGAWLLIQPLALGLLAGAAAAAYRALVPDAPTVSSPPADGPLPAAIS